MRPFFSGSPSPHMFTTMLGVATLFPQIVTATHTDINAKLRLVVVKSMKSLLYFRALIFFDENKGPIVIETFYCNGALIS
jgi:hypothetical protein